MNDNRKEQALNTFRERSDDGRLTTDQGVRVSHTDDSLKAGTRGPTLMEDFHFREKLTHFDHERIPERAVHARGSGAYGSFQVYESLAPFTRARFLTDPSVRTPVFVRFSTVVGSRGSADTVRDARGFATKFYTEEGNYDLVGNNIPVFFIQDGIKFPDLVHAIKPEPDSEMPQASAAHDTFWDFISLMPESMHMVMWVLSDRAIPRSFRMMQGFGVHTFRLINEAGKATFVKFRWQPVLGTHSLVWDEAQKLAGKEPDWLRRDLWEAIERGQYPEYELQLQLIPEEDESRWDFDLLDPTKIVPEELVPFRSVGKMVLNRNPDNFFAEVEQVAFHPGNVVPGIDFTNDPLLHGRLFSYLDTQLIRLGGPNFTEIPINRPLADVHTNHRDGHSRQTIHSGKVSYFPNSLGGGCPMLSPAEAGGYAHYMERAEGNKVRERSESFKDHFSQAAMFWRALSGPEQQRLVEAAQFELGKVKTIAVRERMVGRLNEVDHDLARRVAEGIGVALPMAGGGATPAYSAPEVSIERLPGNSIVSRRVAVLVADGVNAGQLKAVSERLEAEGASTKVVSKNIGMLTSVEGEHIEVEGSFLTESSILFDAVFVPGGRLSIETLKQHGDALHFLNEAFRHCKAIATAGEGLELLETAQIPGLPSAADGSNPLTVSNGVVMGRNGMSEDEFASVFIEAIRQHRHWARLQKEKVPA